MYCTGVLHICSILSRRGEERNSKNYHLSIQFKLTHWHRGEHQRFATCCRLSCACFIICPGGGNTIYYYQHSGWHTDTILLWILSHGAGAGDVIISVIMRRVPECQGTQGADDYLRCSDQVSWHLPRDPWSEQSQIPSSWDSLENCITLRSDQRGLAITRVYTSDITHVIHKADSIFKGHYSFLSMLSYYIGSKHRADLYNRACFVLPLRYENWYHQIFRV